MAKGGRHPPCLEVIQRDEQKSFLFPLPGVVFHVWRTERGSKLKLGLLMCNQSPAHACGRSTEGAAGWGVRDWLIQGCLCMWRVLRVDIVPVSGPGTI